MRRSVVWSTVAALTVGPTLFLVQSTLGAGHLVEAIGGAVVGTTFFASTGIVGLMSREDASLKANLLNAYLIKFSTLVLVFLVVPFERIDRNTAAIAVVGAAVAYLTTQTVLLARRRSSA